jgi:uncharacterized protein with von Willebrand factor type A (vWA) domain
MAHEILLNRDYTLILDKSGSMSSPDRDTHRTRWQAAQESTLALARKCETLDPDGITVYAFSSRFKRYDNVTARKVEQIFQENDPVGSTDLAGVLRSATQSYFERKAKGQAKANGETILIVTDGEPDDKRAVVQVIIQATKQMQRDEELAIAFIQVGDDPAATAYLKLLDDELVDAGAAFDIVDTVTIGDMADMTLAEVLLNAIYD